MLLACKGHRAAFSVLAVLRSPAPGAVGGPGGTKGPGLGTSTFLVRTVFWHHVLAVACAGTTTFTADNGPVRTLATLDALASLVLAFRLWFSHVREFSPDRESGEVRQVLAGTAAKAVLWSGAVAAGFVSGPLASVQAAPLWTASLIVSWGAGAIAIAAMFELHRTSGQ